MNKKPQRTTIISTVDAFFLILIAAFSFTRICLLLLFYILFTYTSYLDRIIEDPFHHYQAGILVLTLSFFITKKKQRLAVQAVSAGLIIEEHVVILEDMGIHIPGYFYLNGADLVVGYVFVAILYIFFRSLKINRQVNVRDTSRLFIKDRI